MKLSVNLHDTLKAYNEATPEKSEEELIIKEANKIIDSGYSDDLKTLSFLGIKNHVLQAISIKNNRENLSKFDEVYDISAIRKLAIHYRLRFLPSSKFSGSIDPVLAVKVRAFCEKHKVDAQYDSHRFYILAPANSFNLEKRPKDPIIFYKIDNEKFAFIHKWGNDFSLFRKLVNIPRRSIVHFACFLLIPELILVYRVLYSPKDGFGIAPSIILGTLITVLIALIQFGTIALYCHINDSDFTFSNEDWDDDCL